MVLFEADRTFPRLPNEHPDWPRIPAAHRRAVRAFHQALRAWAEDGFDIIVDGSLPYGDNELRDECLALLSDFDLRIVGVMADDSALSLRESARPEPRPAGWAVKQAQDINDGVHLAAMVDTTDRTPEECAEDVIRQLGVELRE